MAKKISKSLLLALKEADAKRDEAMKSLIISQILYLTNNE